MKYIKTNFYLSVLLVVTLPNGCRSEEDIIRSDYNKLKQQVVRISKTPIFQMEKEIAKLHKIQLKTERINKIRNVCCRAYEKILRAYKNSGRAKELIKKLETKADSPSSDVDVKEISSLAESAQKLIDQSNALLKEAEKIKNDCLKKMEEVEKKLAYW